MDKVWIFILLGLTISAVIIGAIFLATKNTAVEKIWPRLFSWILFSTLLFTGLFFVHPQQAEVAYYKFALVIGAAVLGYWLDRSIFPYARPDGYLKDFWQKGTNEPIGAADYEVVSEYLHVFALAMLRRAMIISAVILGVTLGL